MVRFLGQFFPNSRERFPLASSLTTGAPGLGWKERMMPGFVEAVSQRSTHSFSKQPRMWIRLLAGLGVEGDAHLGTTVKHRSRVARDPAQPNLRQVHLLHRELLETLETQDFVIGPGDIGENVLTRGLDLLGLPTGAVRREGAGPGKRASEIHASSLTGSSPG
jgi:hypothetical protein